MKMVWTLVAVLPLSLLGCGSNPTNEPPTRLDPKGGPSVSETSQRTKVDTREVADVLDLPEYPNVQIVENNKLVSDSISPDESRFILIRTSKDKPEKVAAFYENELKQKAVVEKNVREIFGRTTRGNFARVLVEADGAGSKITLNIISYAKK